VKLGGISQNTLKNIVVSISYIYTLQVQSYDYFKLGLLTNPKLGM
jgi:hypothetical protein